MAADLFCAGWIYSGWDANRNLNHYLIISGVAVQMTTELGLLLRMNPAESHFETGQSTQDIEEVRRSLFWAVYSADM